MPLFDLFGVKKDLRPEESPAETKATEPLVPGSATTPAGKSSRRVWGIVLACNALLVLGATGLLATRVMNHLSEEPAVTVPQRPPSKVPAAKPEKPPEAKPSEPKKPDAPQPAAVKPAAAAKPPANEKPAAAKPADTKPAAAARPAGKTATRPVPFTYTGSGAKEVALVGPFLVRTGGRKQMFKNSKGAWGLTIYLNIGESYKYRFEVTDAQGRRKLTPAETVEVLQP